MMLIDSRVRDPIILKDVFNDTFKSRYLKLLIGQESVGSSGHQCYDQALLVTGYDVLLSTLQGNLSFSTSSVSSFASTHAGPDYFSLLDLHLRHRTLSDSY